MGERIKAITRETLLPIGLVLAAVGCVWAVATDRQTAINSIENNTAAIARHEEIVRELEHAITRQSASLLRIELKLGSLPEDQ